MEFLLGNPFSSPVGQRIENATSASLPSEDWELNMEICDLVNSNEEGPRDAVRAIKKRIVGNKNFKEVMLTLTVLETCVKNCGYRFHVLVTTRDFTEGVLVRSIIPRNNPPLVLHDRVLSIVQAWADAFRSSPDLTGVVSVYEDLRRKGLEFPMTELEGYQPADSNKKAPSPGNGPAVAARLSSSRLLPPVTSDLRTSLEEHKALTPSQVQQLKAELSAVRSNLTTMSELMSRLDPVTVKQTDMELLEQLYRGCKDLQDKILLMIPRLTEEKLIQELLDTNDQMNGAFTRYHRFERRLANGQNATQKEHTYVNLSDLQSDPLGQSGASLVTSDSSLSLSKPDSLSSQMARLSTSESDETLPAKINLSTPLNTRDQSEVDGLAPTNLIPITQSSVMDDVEKWLALEDEFDDFEDSDGVTSEEFDKFLAGRAKAAERLPSVRSTSQDANASES